MSELALQLPLHGVQLIEASAGTGKTHTLATLYARLVIEARLEVTQLLAVTYTRAATAELRDRLRGRLQQALAQVEDGTAQGGDAALDALLDAARAREPLAALVARLRRAVATMDLAPIHTIHAFCQRALSDFALEAGQPPAPRELLANERELQLEVATEFWRAHSRDEAGARALDALARGPLSLSLLLRELLSADELQPPPPPPADAAIDAEFAQACDALASAWTAHGEEAREQLRAAAVSGAINRQRSADARVDPVWASLHAWADARDDGLLHANLFWFGRTELRGKWNGKHGPLPQSPLFEAIEHWQRARDACTALRRDERRAWLHALREFGRSRLARLKRERGLVGYDDLINDVAAALFDRGEAGAARFAARLQAQYRVALVDEFQDTDLRQSAIFARLFAAPAAGDEDGGAARALFLIGDPKQSIYRFRGGDVGAYLIAAQRAQQRHVLAHNFRSRPRLLHALEALYRHAGVHAFAHEAIGFAPVQPGGKVADTDFERAGAAAPAVTVLTLDGHDAKSPIEQLRIAAARACAAEILTLLQDGAAGRARRRDRHGEWKPVAAGDIAILVEQHEDARLMREALDELAIPATVAGRESVFASAEAEDLRRVLQALRAPSDEGRLRAALATVLLGFDAAALAALDDDESQQRRWQERMQLGRAQLERHGPLAFLNDLIAHAAPRLLQRSGGERALANHLQLGEALQQIAAAGPGLDALLDAFERRIELADRDNEDELLRLESDAERVAIRTLHASKGLEFDFVFLPFIATHGTGRRRGGAVELIRHHDGERRVLHISGDDGPDAVLREIEAGEERAERLRLLYVGLTRARHALWIAWGAAKKVEDTALAWLLHRAEDAVAVEAPDAGRIARDLARWQAQSPDAIVVRAATSPAPGARWRVQEGLATPPVRVVERELARDWWVYSYSMLAREQRSDAALAPGEIGAEDEIGSAAAIVSARLRFVGARFGNSLHAALEHARFERWRDWRDEVAPEGEQAAIDRALTQEGYEGEADRDEGRALLVRLIAATLNARLPEGAQLCRLEPGARRDELEFHLSLAPVALPALLDLLHAHGVVSERRAFGARRRIEGLLTGRIDLVYRHDGRYYLLDYKSNLLPDYAPEALHEAVRHSEYDLQYVLYTLALHRWLRFRVGAGYDYDTHVGGVRYLFCRGLEPDGDPLRGIHAARPSRALIDALDALFAGHAGAAA